MKIFIDTANLKEIREACSWGIIDGLTTNPSLIRRAVEAEKQDQIEMAAYIEEICQTVPGPVSLEVVGLNAKEMVQEAMHLYARFNKIQQNVVIKIPVNTNDGRGEQADFEGLKAISTLAERSVPINATLVMTSEQALLAAKAGAKYVSPFMGRVDDFAKSQARKEECSPSSIPASARLIRTIRTILDNYDLACEVIAASVRHVHHVRAAAVAGAQIATIPFAVLFHMIRHPKTEEGIRRFSEDVIPDYSSLFDNATT